MCVTIYKHLRARAYTDAQKRKPISRSSFKSRELVSQLPFQKMKNSTNCVRLSAVKYISKLTTVFTLQTLVIAKNIEETNIKPEYRQLVPLTV